MADSGASAPPEEAFAQDGAEPRGMKWRRFLLVLAWGIFACSFFLPVDGSMQGYEAAGLSCAFGAEGSETRLEHFWQVFSEGVGNPATSWSAVMALLLEEQDFSGASYYGFLFSANLPIFGMFLHSLVRRRIVFSPMLCRLAVGGAFVAASAWVTFWDDSLESGYFAWLASLVMVAVAGWRIPARGYTWNPTTMMKMEE